MYRVEHEMNEFGTTQKGLASEISEAHRDYILDIANYQYDD